MMMTTETTPALPLPRWAIRTIWRAHRLLVGLSGARLGLFPPEAGRRAGMMRVHAIGRRSGEVRPVVLCYFDDDGDLVTLAMNGWDPAEPQWWLNVQSRPEVRVDLGRRRLRVTARAAEGDERTRLWARVADFPGWGDVDAYSARRPRGTAVVVLTPVSPASSSSGPR